MPPLRCTRAAGPLAARLGALIGALALLTTFAAAQTSWLSTDIGAVASAGSSAESAGALRISGSGADIWDFSDEFRFHYQTLAGDGTLLARVGGITDTNAWAKAAVMLRESLAPDARHAMVCVSPGNGTALQWRAASPGESSSTTPTGSTAPIWLKIVRSGATITGYTSANGSTWTHAGSVTFSALPPTLYAGLAVTSHHDGVLCTAGFDNVSLTAAGAAAAGAPVISTRSAESVGSGYLYEYQIAASNSPTSYSATGLPAGLTLDTATGQIRGVCGFNGGTYTVTLRATNAYGTGEATQTFVVSGSGPIEMPYVREVLPPPDGTYRPGDVLLIRVRFANGYSFPFVTGRPRIALSIGGRLRYAYYAWGSGNEIHGYECPVTTEDAPASGITILDTIDLNGGTIRDSYPLWCALNLRPVEAPGVRIESGAAAPGAWQSQDIGAVAVAGSNSSSGNTISMNGSGADIWDSADAFRFVHRALSGDGVVEAQVSSLTDTHAWAKAGVMIRQSLAPDAPNVFVFLTPANGVSAQARIAAGATTSFTAGPWWVRAPYWVRLVRTGTRITAYASADGVAWTQVAAYDVAMGATVYAGFAVTSHDNTRLSTAVFSDPSVH